MKSTKKSLLLSSLSLIMCVAMLLGTTYAWFTDSVTSGKNKIQAGNLDVELEYSTDMSAWNTVGEDTDLFEDCLWEPGYTQVVYLKVKNVGTLALQYKLGINIFKETKGKNVAGEEFKLSDYIKFGTKADVTAAYETRDAARADVAANANILSEGYTASGYMAKGAADKIVALVVYMPEEVDNVANYRATKPEIELGIELLATQWTKEADSFDDQYDKNAEYPEGTEIVEPKEPVEYDDANHIATINSADGYQSYVNGGKVGYAVELGGDIDFCGAKINTLTLTSLDGKGYSIKNAKADNFLFTGYNEGMLGTVKNITFEGIVINGSGSDSGIFGSAGAVTRDGHFDNVTFNNCKVEGNANYAGVIVGNVCYSTFKDCKAIGCEVTGVKNAGALIGMAQTYGDDTTLTNCSAKDSAVTITIATETRNAIGQLVGRAITPEGDVITLTDCSATNVTLDRVTGGAVATPTLVGDTANYEGVTVNGTAYKN